MVISKEIQVGISRKASKLLSPQWTMEWPGTGNLFVHRTKWYKHSQLLNESGWSALTTCIVREAEIDIGDFHWQGTASFPSFTTKVL